MSDRDPARKLPRGAPFQPGNPGKPKGARNRVTRAMVGLLEGEHERLTRKVVEMGLGGDLGAMRLCLTHLAPPTKDAPLAISLPPIRTAMEALDASAIVVAAMASGEITPSEAGRAVAVLASHAKIVEIADHEPRLQAIEAQYKEYKEEQRQRNSPYR